MSNGGRIGFDIDFNVNKTPLNQLKASLQDLKRMTAQDMADINFTGLDEANKDLEKMQASVRKVERALDRAFNKDLGTLNLTKFNKELQRMDLNSIYENFNRAGDAGRAAFRNTTTEILTANMQMKKSSKILSEIGDTMKNTLKWGVASSVMNSFAGSVQQAFGYIKHLDSSLNDIRIVTGYSADEMDRFAEKANKAAKALAASTTDYTEASLIYYQQGLSGAEVESRAETTLKAANVTGQAAAEVSEQLTAVWNGYKVSAEETEMYVDKLAAVAASTAADLEELSTGMSKVASAAMTSGVNMDQLSATLATVISVTRQAPETVGTAFKTIYARLGDLAVDGVDEFGTSLGAVSKKMATMGIQILDEAGNLREMGTIVEEVAAQWDTWTEAQKQAAAVAMAGKRQYNNLISLFENWDMYESALLTSQTSLGTLSQQQEIYLDSAEASLRQLATSAEGVYDSLLDADTIKAFADGFSNILSFVENFVDGIGGGSSVLLGLGAILTKVFSGQISKGMVNTISNFQAMKTNAQQVEAATKNLDDMKKWANSASNNVDDVTKSIIELESEVQKAAKFLSEEEFNTFQDLAHQYKDAQNNYEQFNSETAKASSMAANITGGTVGEDDFENIRKEAQRVADDKDILKHNYAYERMQKQLKDAERELKKNISDADKFTEQLKSSDNEKDKSKFIDEASAFAERENIINTDLGRHLADDLKIYEKELEKAQAEERDLSQEGVEAGKRITAAIKEASNSMLIDLERVSEQAKREANGMAQHYKEAGDQIKQSIGQAADDFDKMQHMQGVANMFSGVESIAFGVMSLTSAIQSLGDESLTAGQKFLQLTLGLGAGVPMLLSGVGDLLTYGKQLGTKTIPKMAASIGEAANVADAATDASKGFASALKVIGKAVVASPLGRFVLIAGGVVAAIGLIIAAVERADKAQEEATKRAAKNLENLQSQTQQVQQSIIDVQTNLSNYDEATSSMENLTRGTAEWNQKLMEANSYILDIIDKYPIMAQYARMGENGLMSFSPDGLNELQKVQEQQLKTSQTAVSIGQQEYLEAKNQEIKASASGDLGLIAGAIEKGLDEGLGFLAVDSAEDLAKKEKIGFYEAQKIYKNREEIRQAVTEMSANNAAIDSYKQLNYDLNKDSAYQKLESDGDKQIVAAMYEKQFEKEKAEAKKQYGDVSQTYAEKIGATDYKKKQFTDETEYLINDEWVTVSNDIARETLATEDANIKLSDFTSSLDGATKNLINFKDSLLDSGKNSETIGEGKNQRGAMTEEMAATLSLMKKGDKDTDLSQLSNADLADLVKGFNGKGDNEYELNEKYLSELGFEGDNAVQDFKDHVLELVKAEQEARAQAQKDAEKNGQIAINDASDGKVSDPAKLYNSVSWDGLQEGAGIPEDIIKQMDWANAPDDEKGLQKWFAEQASMGIAEANLNAELSAEGLSIEEVEEYAEHLKDIADTSDKVADSLDDDPLAAKAIAAAAKRADKGIKTLEETFKNYGDTLEEGNETVADWTDATDGIKSGMADILDLSDEDMGWMTDDVIKDNLDTIKKAAEGDKDAIQELWAIAGKEFVMDLDLNLPESKMNQMKNLIDEVANEDIEIGATIDDSKYAQQLFDMQVKSGMTADQIADSFSAIGWEPEIIEETHTVSAKDRRRGYVEVPLITGDAAGEGDIPMQRVPVDSDAKVGTEITYYKFKSKNGKTPSMSRKAPAARASANSGNSGGGGGGGSKPKKTYKTSEKKKDRYREVNNSLKELSTELDRLAERQEKLYGKDLLDNLNKQLKVIEKQVAKTKEKLAIAKQEAKEMRTQSLKNQDPDVYNDLLDFGIKFDAAGNISNYNKIFDQWDKKVQDLTDKYNKMSAKEQEKDKDKDNGVAAQLEKASQNRDTLENLIKEYDALIYDTIPGLEDEITEMAYQQIDIKLEGFQIEADLRLDVKEALDNWYDFRKELSEFMDPDDLAGLANITVSKYSEVATAKIEESLAYTTNTLLKELQAWDADPTKYKGQFAARDTLGNILKDEEGNVLFDEVAFREAIQENSAELREAILSQYELIEEVNDLYLEGIDAVAEGFNEHIESLEFIGDQLQHNLRMTELLKGENAYEDFGKIYENQISNLRVQLDEHQKQALYYEKMMLAETDEEARKKYAELHRESLTAAEEIIEATAELLKDKLLNEVKGFIKEFNESMGLPSVIKTKWELQTEYSEEYLDPIEKAYELESLTNKIQQEIAGNDSVYAQKQLNKFLNDELKLLREKDKLSKYEVERANALYELELKKIALAEAQNNKTQMRLRRDASGNYSYQFVADEEEIAQAQQEVLDAQNNLYQMDKDNYQKQQGVLLDQIQNLGEIQQEIAEASSDEERQSLEIRKKALESFIEDTGKQMNLYREYVGESALDLTKLVNGDVSELDVEDMLPDYISATDELIEKINNGEFAEAFKLLGEQAEAAMSEAAEATQNMFNTSEETTQKAIEYADEWTNSLIANNEALQTQLEFLAQKNEEMQKEKENLAKIVELYNEAIAAEKTLAEMSLRDAEAIVKERDAPSIDLSNIASYDTGGYTGDWGSSRGRLEILHQKEMVLDERDTANMMKAVSILRDFSFDALEMKNQLVEKTMEIQEPKQKDLASLHADMVNENMKAVVKSVEASIQRLASALEPTFNAFNAINQQPSENDIYNIEIHAEFPDATNAKEIEQAFLQLTNIATQRAYTTKR